MNFPHRHNDNQTSGHVGVEQIISKSSLQNEHHFQTREVSGGINLGAVSRLVANHS